MPDKVVSSNLKEWEIDKLFPTKVTFWANALYRIAASVKNPLPLNNIKILYFLKV